MGFPPRVGSVVADGFFDQVEDPDQFAGWAAGGQMED
jgi:hypothetical protein